MIMDEAFLFNILFGTLGFGFLYIGHYKKQNITFNIGCIIFVLICVINIFGVKGAYIESVYHNPYKAVVTKTYNMADSSLVKIDTTYVLKK